jgi:hypothetical protein
MRKQLQKNGVPVAILAGGEVVFLAESLEPDVRRDVETALRRGPASSAPVMESGAPAPAPTASRG